MYNTWAQVETVDYALRYAGALMHGYSTVSDAGTPFPVQVCAMSPGCPLLTHVRCRRQS